VTAPGLGSLSQLGPWRPSFVGAVRVNPGEFAAWEAATLAASRRQIGAWVREVAVAGYLAGHPSSAGVAHPQESDPAVAGLRGELGRVGNNLNQLTAQLHRFDGGPQELAELGMALGRAVDATGQTMDRLADALNTTTAAGGGLR